MASVLDGGPLLHGLFFTLFIIGSTSMGYLVIRLSYPEIRVYDPPMKTGYSLLAGALIMMAAFVFDSALIGLRAASEGGWFPLLVVLFCFLGFVFLRAWTALALPQNVQVGLPARRLIGHVPEAHASGDRLEEEFARVISKVSKESDDTQAVGSP